MEKLKFRVAVWGNQVFFKLFIMPKSLMGKILVRGDCLEVDAEWKSYVFLPGKTIYLPNKPMKVSTTDWDQVIFEDNKFALKYRLNLIKSLWHFCQNKKDTVTLAGVEWNHNNKNDTYSFRFNGHSIHLKCNRTDEQGNEKWTYEICDDLLTESYAFYNSPESAAKAAIIALGDFVELPKEKPEGCHKCEHAVFITRIDVWDCAKYESDGSRLFIKDCIRDERRSDACPYSQPMPDFDENQEIFEFEIK